MNYNNTNNIKKLITNCFKLKTKVVFKGNKMQDVILACFFVAGFLTALAFNHYKKDK